MKFFQKVANRFGFVHKSQVSSMHRSYAAAAIDRLTGDWTTQTASADSISRMELSILRARARDLAMNNCHAQKFLTMLKSNVLGDCGLILKNKAMDPPSRDNPKGTLDKYANKVIEDNWWEWGKKKNCTVSKTHSWEDVQNVCLESVGRDSECLVRMIVGFPNDFGFALELIESDQLDIHKNEILANGNEIRMGVELNKWRQPVAYHILTNHPNDIAYSGRVNKRVWDVVPADQIVHPFFLQRIGQTRGNPMLATVMYQLQMIGKYEEAELIAARAGASKMGFYTAESGPQEYTGEQDGAGNFLTAAQPGTFEKIPRGWDVKSIDWNHPNQAYEIFMKTALRTVASGLGVSYNTMANDMESVNFASGKLGIEEERQLWKRIQTWLGCHFADPIFSSWLDTQLLTQRIKLPYSKLDKFNAPDWRGRRWQYMDPQKEIAAKILAIRSGITSITRVLAELGLDRDEIFEEQKDDNQAAEDAGIELPEITADTSADPLTQAMRPGASNQTGNEADQ